MPPPGGSGNTTRTSTDTPLGSAFDGFNPPASPLVKQNYEGTGYDNGETWIETGTLGVINEDYSPALVGLQSLRLVNVDFDSVSTRIVVSPLSECWSFFQMQWVTMNSGTIFHRLQDNASAIMVEVRMGAAGVVTVSCGPTSPTTASTVSTMTTGVKYYVWVHYLKGTGANATAEVWFSTSSTKPGDGTNGHAKTTTGTAAADVAEEVMYIENFSAVSNEAIFDRVYLDDAAIGNNP